MCEKKKHITEYFLTLLKNTLGMAGLCLALLFVLSGAVKAEETNPCSVSLRYSWEGVAVNLYFVGSADSTGEYSLKPEYETYRVNLLETNAADTLARYIRRDQLVPDRSLKTKADGSVTFDNLEKGVYLILAEEQTREEGTLISSPVMLEVPVIKDGAVIYEIQADSKSEVMSADTTSISVIKNWKNDTESTRPSEITVQLIKDGSIVADTAVLSKACSWSKTWKELEAGHVWTVVEKDVPDGYKVSISTNSGRVAIVNTGDNPPPDVPPGERLPYTGQNLWLAPILVAAGLLMILLGLILLTQKK